MIWLVAGCVSPTPTTPVGPLAASGPLPLPAGIERPAALDEKRLKAEICGAPDLGLPPAEVEITARGFAVGPDRHLAEYEVAVTRSSPNLEIRVNPPTGGPSGASLEPGAPWLGVATVSFDCVREARVGLRAVSQRGADFVQVRADGARH